MPPYCYETPKSRKWQQDAASGTLTRTWFVGGTSDWTEARELLLANNPLYFYGLARKRAAAEPLGAPDLWAGEVEYGASAVPDGLKPDEMSFQIGTQSVHVAQSYETKFRRQFVDNGLGATAVGTATDFENAIGVTLDQVQGTDVLVPDFKFKISRQRAFVDFPYVRTLRNLCGKTNSAEFYGFPAGTLLYLGCEPTSAVGTLDTGEKFDVWNLSHSFGYEEARTNFTVGTITVPKKNGWEYVWARYGAVKDAGRIGQRPDAIYVERVYPEGNFALLEIGGAAGGGGD